MGQIRKWRRLVALHRGGIAAVRALSTGGPSWRRRRGVRGPRTVASKVADAVNLRTQREQIRMKQAESVKPISQPTNPDIIHRLKQTFRRVFS